MPGLPTPRFAVRTLTAAAMVLAAGLIASGSAIAATRCGGTADAPLPIAALPTSAASKAEAILGAPSRLLELQQQQAGEAVLGAVPSPAAGPTTFVRYFEPDLVEKGQASIWPRLDRERMLISPTQRAADDFEPVRLDLTAGSMAPLSPCSEESWVEDDAGRVSEFPKTEYVTAGHPDIFGSVALSVGRTPLDLSWTMSGVTGDLPAAGPWAALIHDSRDAPLADKIARVNAWVNSRLIFTDDRVEYGRADYWAPAATSLLLGKGDCEDYAIAKLQLLAALGVSRDDLYLVIVRDLTRRADHAILAVQIDGQMVVLDNQTDRVIPTGEIRDYRPVLTYSHESRWTHGYRSEPAAASIQLASLQQ